MADKPAEFVYAGGEFADDAPYVEELHGLGVAGTTATFGQAANPAADGSSSSSGAQVAAAASSSSNDGLGDLDTLLSSIIDNADGDDDVGDADTCFSINAAASFAALVAPEEQLAEITFKAIDAEQAQAAVDVLTPMEIVQLTLFLQQFRVADRDSSSDYPSFLRSIPLFVPSASTCTLRSDWFLSAEKQLQQGLAVFSIGLNRENVPVAAVSAAGGAAAPARVYSLLFRGSKVTSELQLSSIRSDLHSLLALPDVIQPSLLIMQLVSECTRNISEIMKDVSAMMSANKTGASASSASAASSPDVVERQLVSQLNSMQITCASELALTTPFTVDLDGGELRCPNFSALATAVDDQLAPLRELLGMPRSESSSSSNSSNSSSSSADASSASSKLGALLPRVLSYLFLETIRAVWSAVIAAVVQSLQMDVDPAALAASLEPSIMMLMLCNQSSASPLASLLSADISTSASDPAEWFARFLPAQWESEIADMAEMQDSSSQATARYLTLRHIVKQMQATRSAAAAATAPSSLPSVPSLQRAILLELLEQ